MKKIIVSFSYLAFALFFAGTCVAQDAIEQQRKTLQQRQKKAVKKTASTKTKSKTPKRSHVAEIAKFNADGDIKSFTEASERFVTHLKNQKSSIDIKKQLLLNRSLLRFTKTLGTPKFATKEHISAVSTIINTIKTKKDLFTLPSLIKGIERQINNFEKNTKSEEAFEQYKKEQEDRIKKAKAKKPATKKTTKKDASGKKKALAKKAKKPAAKAKKSITKKSKNPTKKTAQKDSPSKKKALAKKSKKTATKAKKSTPKKSKKTAPKTTKKEDAAVKTEVKEEKIEEVTQQQIEPSSATEETTPEVASLPVELNEENGIEAEEEIATE